MAIESGQYRRALGCFATGVTVVTTLDAERQPVGVTISALASLSLEPPLILFCLGKRTSHLAAYLGANKFVVSILSEQQRALSESFAQQEGDKFAGVAWRPAESGCPILKGCIASLECTKVAVHDGGDHHIVVGHVDRAVTDDAGRPLIHFRGGYAKIGGTL